MIEATLITGPGGCGKSTLGRLVREKLADVPGKLVCIDTSRCIKNSRERMTRAGKELAPLMVRQLAGYLLPGDSVTMSVRENFGWIEESIHPFHIILLGSPRTVEEAYALLKWQEERGIKFKILLIECTEDEVKAGVQSRIDDGVLRADDGAEEMKVRWDEYNGRTVECLNVFPREMVTHTKRSFPLLQRVTTLVEMMPIPSQVRSRWLRRLDTDRHPIRLEIDRIESGIQIPDAPVSTARRYPPGYFFQPGNCRQMRA